MEENNQNQTLQPEESISVENVSATEAITGMFTEPGETFESISKVNKKNYWILPLIIVIIAGVISTFLFTMDEQLTDKVFQQQKEKIISQMEESVKSGKMSREQADVSIEQSLKFVSPKSVLFQVFGYIGTIVMPFVILFLLSLVYLVIFKIMKTDFEYVKLLNVIGLSMIVTAIGSIVAIVLSIIVGDFTNLSPGLILNESMVGKGLYSFLSKLDVFTIWFFVLMAIGLSKITKIELKKSYIIVFSIWIVYVAISTFTSVKFS